MLISRGTRVVLVRNCTGCPTVESDQASPRRPWIRRHVDPRAFVLSEHSSVFYPQAGFYRLAVRTDNSGRIMTAM